jgi:hypothetical protein
MNTTPMILVLGFILVCTAEAATWERQLRGGDQIQVDPTTHKAYITDRYGKSVPLWDGVHYLKDGSRVEIRSGVMVPTPELRDWERQQRKLAAEGEDKALLKKPDTAVHTACTQLVRKVCGAHDECASSQGCSPARQLLKMEQQEMRQTQYTTPKTFTTFQCEEALHDEEFFVPCKGAVGQGLKGPAQQSR